MRSSGLYKAVTVVCAIVTLIMVALISAFFPARRASKLDPTTALRLG